MPMDPPLYRRPALAILLVTAGLGVVLALAAARLPVCREQELRVVLTARTMADRGEWFRPTYRGAPRYQKPPTMYWLTALAYRTWGTSNSAAVARLPGLAFALGLVAVTYAGGRGLVGRRGAVMGATFAAASYAMLRFGFRAETDIAQSFWTTVAVLAAWAALRARRGAALGWLAAGLAAGTGVMTKSPAPALIVLLTVAIAAVICPALRRPARGVGLAALAAAAVAMPWYVVSMISAVRGAAGEAVSHELNVLLRRPTHPGPWFYYAYALPAAIAPWSLVLPPALLRLVRRVRGRARDSFLTAWLAAGVLLLSVLGNKQIHYTTLLVPPAALAMGAWTARLRTRRGARLMTLYGRALALALGAGGLAAAIAAPALRIEAWPWGVGLGLALAAAGVAAWRQAEAWPHVPAPAALLGLALAALSLSGPWAPWIEDEQVIVPFARHLRDRLPSTTAVWTVGDDDGALEFHLGRAVIEAPSFEWAWAHSRTNDVVIVAATDHQFAFPEVPPPVYEVRHRSDRIAAYARPPLADALR